MKKSEKKRVAYQITLILMALYFSLLESMIPKPFPWMRIGLSNIATLIGIEKFGVNFGIEIVILRIFINSFMLGTMFTPNFFISLGAGFVTVIIMGGLFKFRKYLSLISISGVAGLVHNFIQLIIVYFLLFRNISIFEREIFIFILFFIVMGFISGAIVGFFAEKYRV
ncbi:Gx transporter family protein [Haliovirga abyssi]|uniref:Membrane protein n=1 Tax=Haliovirga abyssi TaxID=2996794 RepID=A0AAU9DGU0_9FUSO|nr:Gx transporter family protein [Haliovirga abyssi]BDU49919.1 membrane protein [Haliovirga abyssi]